MITLVNTLTNRRWTFEPGNGATINMGNYPPGIFNVICEGANSYTIQTFGGTIAIPSNTNWTVMNHDQMISVGKPNSPPIGKQKVPGRPDSLVMVDTGPSAQATFAAGQQPGVGGLDADSADGGPGYSLPPPLPPQNIDVPAVTLDGAVQANAVPGDTLYCTTGNWTGTPHLYHYQWLADGTAVGTDQDTYEVQTGDVGKQINCIVTAVDEVGESSAPPSNSVLIEPDPTGVTVQQEETAQRNRTRRR